MNLWIDKETIGVGSRMSVPLILRPSRSGQLESALNWPLRLANSSHSSVSETIGHSVYSQSRMTGVLAGESLPMISKRSAHL